MKGAMNELTAPAVLADAVQELSDCIKMQLMKKIKLSRLLHRSKAKVWDKLQSLPKDK